MTATARIIQLSPPARTQRATKPKATPSPYVSVQPEVLAAMASLGLAHSRAQRTVTGSFTTRSAADDLRALLAEVIRHAQNARSGL